MSAIRRVCFSQLLFLVGAFLAVGCTHDNVAATPDAEPTTATPAAVPETSPPIEPVPATPPVEPATPNTPESKPGDTLTLKPGQSAAAAAGTTLHYVRLVNDSRCPVGAQCIWAGEVTIELLLDSGKEKQTFMMKDDEQPATVLGYKIELISIDRGHLINVRVKKI